jgi:hypothetical protein
MEHLDESHGTDPGCNGRSDDGCEAVELSKRETADERIASATRLGFVSYARAMREGGR